MYKAGAYLRISNEDLDGKGESDSIENQRILIQQYVDKTENIEIVEFYIDDGFSGLSFERPGFRRMLSAIERGQINCVITKDMSRLGRDRLQTGIYIEKYFPINKIRYIAILDNYDSLTGSNEEIAPFKGLLNEMYARDISKKVKGAFNAKREQGLFIGAFAPYGYKKDPENKNRLLIDTEAADVVRRIFNLFISGKSKLIIAKALNADGIPCPTAYKWEQGLNYHNSKKLDGTVYWTYSTVARILENRAYLGSMIQGKEESIFKGDGKKITHHKSEWLEVQQTHEPIVTQEEFDIVQEINRTRTRTMNTTQNVSIFAGKLRCSDCGRSMSKTIVNDSKHTVWYKCGTYKGLGKDMCSAHSIKEETLESIIIQAIRSEAEKVLKLQDIQALLKEADTQNKPDISRDIDRLNQKLDTIGKYRRKAYEDYVDELLSKKEYISLKETYDKEELEINDSIDVLKSQIINLDEKLKSHRQYLKAFIQYIGIEHLTREVIVELVDYIKVFENKKLEIKFRFTGSF